MKPLDLSKLTAKRSTVVLSEEVLKDINTMSWPIMLEILRKNRIPTIKIDGKEYYKVESLAGESFVGVIGNDMRT